ncbi:MAG: hypothetical protein ACTHN5_07805 [Phycisphaerae bacterium]
MPAGPYIPSRDSLLDTWAANFATTIAANPAAAGLSAGDATTITTAQTNYHNAYTLLTNPATKTPTNVAAKNVAKASMLVTLRTYANLIQSNNGVTNPTKSALGLTIRSTGRTPIPAPGTVPILGLVGQQPGVATIKYSDTSTPTSKKKPYGALALQLAYQVAPTGSPDPADASIISQVTKSPFAFNTPTGGLGKAVYLWGRWITRKGLVGPWSVALSFTGT